MSPVERVKNKLNKDTVGAIGAGGGATFLIAWSGKIAILFKALYESQGLTAETLQAATDLSTDAVVIVGSAIVAYVASKFMKQ